MASTFVLSHAVPSGSPERLLLFAIRRLAFGGIDDAQASAALISGFGHGFGRPLVMLRTLVLECRAWPGARWWWRRAAARRPRRTSAASWT
jgi:hypothetical protein